jgi:hypothetical protein
MRRTLVTVLFVHTPLSRAATFSPALGRMVREEIPSSQLRCSTPQREQQADSLLLV